MKSSAPFCFLGGLYKYSTMQTFKRGRTQTLATTHLFTVWCIWMESHVTVLRARSFYGGSWPIVISTGDKCLVPLCFFKPGSQPGPPHMHCTLKHMSSYHKSGPIDQAVQKIDRGSAHAFVLHFNNGGWAAQPANRTLTQIWPQCNRRRWWPPERLGGPFASCCAPPRHIPGGWQTSWTG